MWPGLIEINFKLKLFLENKISKSGKIGSVFLTKKGAKIQVLITFFEERKLKYTNKYVEPK